MSQNNTSIKRQIIALGGGGFSTTGSVSLIDKYILSSSISKTPKVCFVPTASGDADGYIDKFYKAFSMTNCYLSHFSVFRSNHPAEFLLDQDIIYVGGGNTFNMLQLWSARGVDVALKEAYQKGVVLCGISAGSLCWFEAGNTDSFGKNIGRMDKITGLGILPYSNSPHFNTEPSRRPNFADLIRNKNIPDGYGVDENVALHFIDEKLHQTIKETEVGSAYFIQLKNGQIVEKLINPTNLQNNS